MVSFKLIWSHFAKNVDDNVRDYFVTHITQKGVFSGKLADLLDEFYLTMEKVWYPGIYS